MENTEKRILFYNGKCIHGFLINVSKQFLLSIFERKLLCAFQSWPSNGKNWDEKQIFIQILMVNQVSRLLKNQFKILNKEMNRFSIENGWIENGKSNKNAIQSPILLQTNVERRFCKHKFRM